MRYFNTPAFVRQIGKLPKARKLKVKEAYHKIINFFEKKIQPAGLGLKKIRGDIWRVRISGGDRILMELAGDRVTFVFAGNHDEYKRFLSKL